MTISETGISDKSRIHWTAFVSLVACLLAIGCIAIMLFVHETPLLYMLPHGSLVWGLGIFSILGLVLGIIALLMGRNPKWKKGTPFAIISLIISCILIMFSLFFIQFSLQFQQTNFLHTSFL